MNSRKITWLRRIACLSVSGVVFQLGGCLNLGGVANFASSINPCGTILNCDPEEYQFLTSGYEGPGADPNVDLNCTFPPYCEGPIVPAGPVINP
jgi:hypothetical protein